MQGRSGTALGSQAIGCLCQGWVCCSCRGNKQESVQSGKNGTRQNVGIVATRHDGQDFRGEPTEDLVLGHQGLIRGEAFPKRRQHSLIFG